jgi:uncharacterized repeat protein (TIGR02543 family)
LERRLRYYGSDLTKAVLAVLVLSMTLSLTTSPIVAISQKWFTSTISPTTANAGEIQTYTITITDDWSSSSGIKLGSAIMTIPSGFTSVSITTVTASGGKDWTGTIDSGQIKLTADSSSDRLDRGEHVSVSFSATAPAAVDTYEWTTTAYTSPSWAGDLFNLEGSQPVVTVVGPSIDAQWGDDDCSQIDAIVTNLDIAESYYVKYFDPDGILRGTSSTYSGVSGFTDHFVLDITLPHILGTWTVKLYETPAIFWDQDTVSVDKMVWTTDSSYATVVTSFIQGSTVYFKAIGLDPSYYKSGHDHDYYYRFRLDPPSGPHIDVGSWTPGVTELTGSYVLSSSATLGSWKLHVRQATSSSGNNEQHYVDCYFQVTPLTYSLTFDAVVASPLPDVAPATVIVTGTIGGTPFTVTNSELPKTFTGIAAGTTIIYSYTNPVDTTISGKRLWLVEVTCPPPEPPGFELEEDTTITGHYKVQYQVTFAQTGLGSDSSGTVLTVGAVTKTRTQLSFTDWFDAGTIYSYSNPVASSTGGKRYRLDSVTGPASPIANPGTVTGDYKAQYQVTFDQSGLDADATGTVVTIGGSITKTRAQLPFTDWFDSGTTYSYADPVSSTISGKRYVKTGITGPASPLSTSGTVIGNYKTQFYITVVSGHDSPTASDWVDKGSNYATSVTSPTEVVVDDHRWVCTGYKLDGGSLNAGSSYTFTDVQAPHTILYEWKEQFWIQVNSLHDTPTASDWVDQGGSFATGVTSPADDDGFGTRYRCTGYTLDANPPVTDGTASYGFVNVQSAHVITWNWIVQYRLVVASDHDSPNPSVGDHWYDTGAEVAASVTTPADQSGGIRYACTGYAGTGSVGSGSDDHVTFNIGEPSTLTWNWIAQYGITIDQTGVGSDFTGTIVIVDASNYGYTDLPQDFWWDLGSVHNFAFQSPLVVAADVKQYLWDSTSGLSLLQSDSITVSGSGSITGDYVTQYKVRFAQLGLSAAATGTVATIDTVAKTYADLPFLTGWLDEGSSVAYSYEAIVGSTNPGEQFRLDHVTGPVSPITVSAYTVVTGDYVTQFYLTMTTNFGSILPGSGWHDAGSHVTISAAAPIAVAGERYVWLGWTGTGTVSYTGALNSVGITMNGPITEAGAWRHEFRLTVASLYDSPNPTVGDHWYTAGTTINAVVTSPVYPPGGTRYVCTGWTGSGSVPPTGNTTAVTFVIAAPSTITWNWKIQYYLNVTSAHGTIGGEGWYDPGATAYALVTPLIVEEPGGIRYVFVDWTGDATGNTSPSDPILMDSDKVAIANWNLELHLDVVSAYDSPYGTGWYAPGVTANFGVTTPVDLGNGTLMVFVGWSGDVTQTAPTGSIVMTKSSTVVAAWIRQYLVTFNTTLPNGNLLTIPGVPQALPPGFDIFGAFYAAGSTAAGGPAPLITPGPDGTRYVFKGWDLDGVLLTPGTDFSFFVNGPHNASMIFDTEFLLVVNATGVATPFNATLTITASPPAPYQLTPASAVEEWFGKNVGLSLQISTPNKIGHGVWAVFKQWSGNAQGTDLSVSLVMSGPKTVGAVFFSTNPVAESLLYSIVAGLVCFGLAYYMTRNKKGEQKGSTRTTFGIAVAAIALLVAAIMSAMIATGFGINVGELPDLTNWAVLFLGAEALVLFYITYRFTKGGQPEKAQAAPETAKVPANPYGV